MNLPRRTQKELMLSFPIQFSIIVVQYIWNVMYNLFFFFLLNVMFKIQAKGVLPLAKFTSTKNQMKSLCYWLKWKILLIKVKNLVFTTQTASNTQKIILFLQNLYFFYLTFPWLSLGSLVLDLLQKVKKQC